MFSDTFNHCLKFSFACLKFKVYLAYKSKTRGTNKIDSINLSRFHTPSEKLLQVQYCVHLLFMILKVLHLLFLGAGRGYGNIQTRCNFLQFRDDFEDGSASNGSNPHFPDCFQRIEPNGAMASRLKYQRLGYPEECSCERLVRPK